jgi:hypothetical protein
MIIPVPCGSHRLLITLQLSLKKPMELGLLAFDPSKPNTHYLRRKFNVEAGHKEVNIPLPVSPKKLMIELSEKFSGSDKHIQLDNVEVNPFPEGEIWAAQERHRFMDFAIGFAQKAGYVNTGFYHSPDYEFLIHYVPVIQDEGKELVTPARIRQNMPRVQLSQKSFRLFSIPVRVAILAHEACHFFRNTRSEREADLCGIKYYLDSGFPEVEAVYAATKVFNMHPDTVGPVHIRRSRDILEFIKQYQNHKQKIR